MAKMLIENMTKPFVAEDYHDEYQEITRYEKYIEGRQILYFTCLLSMYYISMIWTVAGVSAM